MQKPDLATAPQIPAAILFDCDGTLLLTGELHFTALKQSLARQGARIGRDWYMTLTGLGRSDLLSRLMQDSGQRLDPPRAIADSIALTVALAREARENPLVVGLARLAAGRLPLGVVTNSEAAIVTAFLAETGLRPLFDLVLSCDDAPRPKPAPDLYLKAAAALGVAPQDCLVLEDSTQGIAAATAAGMRCLDVRQNTWPAACKGLEAALRAMPAAAISAR